MNLRRAVTPFALGLFKHKGTWRRTSGSGCDFEPYGFPETSKKEEDKATKVYRRFGPRSDSFIKFSTANVCPAVVIVSPEKRIGGSGIIIDSNGTILTHARNIFSPDFRSKINVSLHDRRNFSGTILEVNEDHDLALLKIQSEIPLPTAMFGSLENYKGNLMLSDEEFRSIMDYGKFSLGFGGGPIVTLEGEVVVGISTAIDLIYPLRRGGSCGAIKAMGIEEALSKVGYPKEMILELINR